MMERSVCVWPCLSSMTGVNTSVWLERMRMLSMVMRQVTTSDSPAGLAMGRAASWCMLLPCAQAASGASARSDVAMMCLIDISCCLIVRGLRWLWQAGRIGPGLHTKMWLCTWWRQRLEHVHQAERQFVGPK